MSKVTDTSDGLSLKYLKSSMELGHLVHHLVSQLDAFVKLTGLDGQSFLPLLLLVMCIFTRTGLV